MKKRIALVTGGTRGIGKAICIALRDAGFSVVANYACGTRWQKIHQRNRTPLINGIFRICGLPKLSAENCR